MKVGDKVILKEAFYNYYDIREGIIINCYRSHMDVKITKSVRDDNINWIAHFSKKKFTVKSNRRRILCLQKDNM